MALCANTEYLLCDEVFDGLDPVATEVMKDGKCTQRPSDVQFQTFCHVIHGFRLHVRILPAIK